MFKLENWNFLDYLAIVLAHISFHVSGLYLAPSGRFSELILRTKKLKLERKQLGDQ